MKTKITYALMLAVCFLALSATSKAQLLNKLKRKAESAATKSADKPATNSEQPPTNDGKESDKTTASSGNTQTASATPGAEKKSPGESDFIPGSTVLYFDNFEKEKNGDSPAGWLTTSSAEVVSLDDQKGKWLKLASVNSTHITRNKKQSWSNAFTVEFDLVIVMKDYDPRIDFSLINTGSSLVTDEMILRNKKNMVYVSTILGQGGKSTRVSLFSNNDINHPVNDRMSDELAYTNYIPVHVAMCVQGKRFRFWWNNKKIYDMQTVNEQYMPNQLGFNFGNVGGAEYYVTNIRVAKDIPATKPANTNNGNNAEQATNNNPSNTDTKTATDNDSPATLKLQSKILTTSLPYAQFMKTGENTYTFIASKEEGNSKENYFKLFLKTGNTSLKPETYNFKEINQKNPLYGAKQYPEITGTEAVLYYGTAQKPYIYRFSPIVANGTMASYVDESLARHLPAPSATTKLVIEKVENGKASGYFLLGIMIQGLKPVKKGDAMMETFTDGFSGEMKCTFTNVPVY